MKKVFVMLFLALGASAVTAQSQKLFNGRTHFRATLPEFSYDGKAQMFIDDMDENGIQKYTFYSDNFTKEGELAINPVEYEFYQKREERALVDGKYTGAWEVKEEINAKGFSGVFNLHLNDFDQSCDDFRNIFLTQTLFNTDDKYEYLLPIISPNNGGQEEDRDRDGQVDLKFTWTDAVVTNDFWDNWFVQAGLGLALINGYGCNFSHVFPNGSTFGISAGMGKWLTPAYGLRAGVNWQNGLIGNRRLAWLDKKDQPGSNHDTGGFVVASLDVLLNLNNLMSGYDEHRRWNTIVYPRVGLGHNFDVKDSSPSVALGVEQTYRLGQRTSLYGDIAYHFTSGGFMGKDHESSHVNAGSNGFFLIDLGVRYDLGKTNWDRPGENRPAPQVMAGHNWQRFAVNTIASVGVAFAAKTALKAMVKEERPDHSDNQSFPSGHASMAFAAARSVDKEFRKDCIWIPIAGYAAATAIGVERVVSDRHHWYDVVAGAGVGIGAAELTWWLSDKLFGKGRQVAVGCSGNTVDVTIGM